MRIVGGVIRISFGATVLSDAHPNRVLGKTRGLGYGQDPTPSESQSLTGRPAPTQLLVHDGGQRTILLLYSGNRLGSSHYVILYRMHKIHQVILEQPLIEVKPAIPEQLR